MKKILITLIAGVSVLALYLLFWPVKIDPAVASVPPAPALEGVYAPNDFLSKVARLGEAEGLHPEDIAVDTSGRIYGGLADGRILRWKNDAREYEVFADTGGRPLGLAFDRESNLIVADSGKGLLSIDPEGAITVLTTECDGKPFKFTDDVDIAADGTIYFSDASWKFGQEEYVEDLLEHRPNGRLLAYSPKTGETRLVVDNLYFANGVAVSPDQRFVLVVETGMYRVMRYWIAGDNRGKVDKLIDNLPGFPDGVSAGTNGIFWVPLASPRDPLMDDLMPRPGMRKVVARLPGFLRPDVQRYSFVLGINAAGEVVHNLQDPGGAYAPITSVEEHDGMLYFGTIKDYGFGRISRPQKPVEDDDA
jgi:sugar lactone lactonase YvrE